MVPRCAKDLEDACSICVMHSHLHSVYYIHIAATSMIIILIGVTFYKFFCCDKHCCDATILDACSCSYVSKITLGHATMPCDALLCMFVYEE